MKHAMLQRSSPAQRGVDRLWQAVRSRLTRNPAITTQPMKLRTVITQPEIQPGGLYSMTIV